MPVVQMVYMLFKPFARVIAIITNKSLGVLVFPYGLSMRDTIRPTHRPLLLLSLLKSWQQGVVLFVFFLPCDPWVLVHNCLFTAELKVNLLVIANYLLYIVLLRCNCLTCFHCLYTLHISILFFEWMFLACVYFKHCMSNVFFRGILCVIYNDYSWMKHCSYECVIVSRDYWIRVNMNIYAAVWCKAGLYESFVLG